MSVQRGLWDSGVDGPENRAVRQNPRASLYREMRYLLAINTKASGAGRLSSTGLVHSLGVCLTEDWIMARGKGAQKTGKDTVGMPRFVDVTLSSEQREEFTVWERRSGDLVALLQSMADDGYRVGVSWSGAQQAYTVSITCRQEGSVNEGLCMTSFAKTLSTALWLALYKHVEVTQGDWVGNRAGGSEDFG